MFVSIAKPIFPVYRVLLQAGGALTGNFDDGDVIIIKIRFTWVTKNLINNNNKKKITPFNSGQLNSLTIPKDGTIRDTYVTVLVILGILSDTYLHGIILGILSDTYLHGNIVFALL